jgi:2-methylcitrate dehydratase PrpD
MTDGPFTEDLIAFVVDEQLQDAAGAHFPEAVRALIDSVAVMVAGADSPATKVVLDSLSQLGSGRSSVVGSRSTLPLLDAILVNAVAAHALDFDDTIQGFTTHPSCHLVPALLGLASQYGCTGPELLTSYLVGLQAEHCITAAMGRQPYQRGWHTTGTVGTIATALAAARLLRLTPAQARAAMAAAASAASGLRANFGTMVKPLHAGRAARSGAESAILARKGLTAAQDPLLHRFGLFPAMGSRADSSLEPCDLNGFPVLQCLAFKPYPCCGEATGAVEAAAALHHQAPLPPRPRAEIRIGPFAREILEFDSPQTADEARFSITYCVWTALRTGTLTVDDFTDTAIAAAAAERFDQALKVVVDPDLGHERAAEVTLVDGNRPLSRRVDVPRGDPSTGFTDADVRAKYMASVANRVDPDMAMSVLDQLFGLGSAVRVGDYAAALRQQ